MQHKILSINAVVMSFMLSCLVFGFLAIGTASAETTQAKSGTWVDKKYSIAGEWTIEQRGDQQVISFSDSFKTKSGPDLKVFLSPQSIDSVTGKTAVNNAVLVSVLQKPNGSQEYVIPAGVNLSWGGTNL